MKSDIFVFLQVAGLSIMLSNSVQAEVVSDYFYYDGSYAPATSTPPAGCTKWVVYENGSLNIAPNTPVAGVTDINDSTNNARIAIYKGFTDVGFGASPSLYEYEYSFKMEIKQGTDQNDRLMIFGVRNEGNYRAGRTIAITFNTSGELCFVNASITGFIASDLGGTGKNYVDGQTHIFMVKKIFQDGSMKIQTYVDGELIDQRLYSDFDFADGANTDGFGIWSSTEGKAHAVVDEMSFYSERNIVADDKPMVHWRFNNDGKDALSNFERSTLFYDGSYAPDSASPPSSNTTWNVFANGSLSIVPNSPVAGVANFNDNSGGARIAMTQTFSNPEFNSFPNFFRWEFTFKMQLMTKPNNNSYPMPFGLRSEGNDCNGRAIALAFDTSGQLRYANAAFNGFQFTGDVGGGLDYADGQMHTFTVKKVVDGQTCRILTYVDGSLTDERNYLDFPSDSSNGEGFGIWSSTPGTSRYVLDYAHFSLTPPVEAISDFRFDGSYTPDSFDTPEGNSRWTTYVNGALTITTNTPVFGVTEFNDYTNNARIAMYHLFSDADVGFNTAPAGYSWDYTFVMELVSKPTVANSYFGFGVRNEGNGANGKAIALGFNENGELGFLNAGFGTFFATDIGGNGVDYADGLMHTVTVSKVIGLTPTKIVTTVDGTEIDERDYSGMPNDASHEGFGLWHSTQGTCNIRLSEAQFSLNPDIRTALDSSGGERHAAIMSGVSFTQNDAGGLTNRAVYFDGTSDSYMRNSALNTLGSALSGGVTLEFWIKTTTTAQSSVMGILDNIGTETALQVDLNSTGNFQHQTGTTILFVRGGSGYADLTAEMTADIYDGKWHHVVCVINNPSANDVAIYVDGTAATLNGIRQMSPTIFDNFDRPFIVGGRNLRGTINNFSDINLDEVAIYDYPLSGERVLAHYEEVFPPQPPKGTLIILQ